MSEKNKSQIKAQKKSSGLPISIIILAFVLVVISGIWLYNTSGPSAPSNTNRAAANSEAQRPQFNPANAPPGAPVGVNMIGSPTATVTVEEFADYQCGACASVYPIVKELQAAYAGNKNFRFIFRHYPLNIPGHDKSGEASAATEAAGLQGKFWQMQDLLFRNQQAWTTNPNYLEIWTKYATDIGLDVNKFKSDLAGMQTKERVQLDVARGRGMGVSSTPTILINDQIVAPQDINIASLRRLVDAEIQRTSTQAQQTPTGANTAATGNANSNTK